MSPSRRRRRHDREGPGGGNSRSRKAGIDSEVDLGQERTWRLQSSRSPVVWWLAVASQGIAMRRRGKEIMPRT